MTPNAELTGTQQHEKTHERTRIHEHSERGQPLGLPLNDQLGLIEPVGHLHSDGTFCQDKAVDAPVWWPVSMYTEDQARAMLAAERERCARLEALLQVANARAQMAEEQLAAALKYGACDSSQQTKERR